MTTFLESAKRKMKIQNLQIHETTSVNGRRIDQRFLQDGDDVLIMRESDILATL